MALSSTKALLLSATQAVNKSIMRKTKIPSSVSVQEITLPLQDGMTLAGQRWTYNNSNNGGSTTTSDNNKNNTSKHKILALHGWLDNSASFHYLAPHLIHRLKGKAELVALDLPGHGLSTHKSIDGPPTLLSEGVYYVAEALYQLGWTTTTTIKNKELQSDDDDGSIDTTGVTLIGHSMGGGLCQVYAAAYPEHVNKLVLLDMYSPLPGECDKTTSLLRSHIETRKKGAGPHRKYQSLEQAIQTRQLTAAKAPGKQWLSLEAATEMVTRATVPVENENGTTNGYSFRHDTRLLWPSLQYLMPEQIDSILKLIECPTCIIAAEHGWPFKKDRVDTSLNIIQPSVHKVLPGSHHLHADPDTAEAVLEEVYHFVAEKKMKYVL